MPVTITHQMRQVIQLAWRLTGHRTATPRCGSPTRPPPTYASVSASGRTPRTAPPSSA
jgi:hypothetical protein